MFAHHSALVPARPISCMVGSVDLMSVQRYRHRAPAGRGEDLDGKELGETADHRGHVPVLLAEVMEALGVGAGGTYIDATFGAGSYSQAIVASHETTRVLALARDREAVGEGAGLVARAAGRLTLVEGRFGEIADIARDLGFPQVDGVVFDIGVSSMQID